MAGSTGVILPPKGYLERLRAICDKHGILLIFDEVITGFGRLGTAFGADWYGVQPDMLNFAKCVTNGVIPLGGVVCSQRIYDAIQRDGFYVRVPSGKQFYLYVLQTIDRADARVGATGSASPATSDGGQPTTRSAYSFPFDDRSPILPTPYEP